MGSVQRRYHSTPYQNCPVMQVVELIKGLWKESSRFRCHAAAGPAAAVARCLLKEQTSSTFVLTETGEKKVNVDQGCS